jgi:hypothetical protein
MFTISGFVAAPLVLRPVAEHQLGRRLGRKVTIERVRMNPFAVSATVEGFRIMEADGATPFLSFRRLYVNLELASSVFRRAPVVREIRLESPEIRIERRQAPTGSWTRGAVYNFTDILARLAAGPAAPEPADDDVPARFSLNNLHVAGGALIFEDRPLAGHHEIRELTLGVPFISTLPIDVDTFVAPGLSGRANGTPFGLKARSKPFKDTRETFVELRFDTLDLTRYLPYLPVRLPAAVSSALLSVALEVSFLRPRDQVPSLSVKGNLALGNVAVREGQEDARPLVGLRRLAVSGLDADLTGGRLAIDKVLLSGLDLHVRRLASGRLNLARLLPQSVPARTPAGPTPAPSTPPGRGRFSLGKLRIDSSTVSFRDEKVRPAFEGRVDDLSLSIDGLSNASDATATVVVLLRASPGGRVEQRGRLSLDPLAASGTIAIDGFEPRRFAPYYQHRFPLEVIKGRLSLSARHELTSRRGRVAVHLRAGALRIHDLALRQTGARNELLRLAELTLQEVDADLDRRRVSVAEARTRQGQLRVTRDQRGELDLLARADALPSRLRAVAQAPAVPAPGWQVGLARLDVQGWDVSFEDRSVNPPASVALQSLSLHATSLSTVAGSQGNVDLRCGLGKRGRVILAGSVSLEPPVADLRLDLRTVELVPWRSYLREQLNLIATSGLLSFKGQARVELGPPPAPRVRLAGDAAVVDFAALDGAGREPLFRWRSLQVGGLKLSTPPVKVAIQKVSLSDFGARVIVLPDGHLNLQAMLAASRPAPKDRKAVRAGPPPAVSVGRVTLERGEIRFTDRMIQPSYSTQLTDLAGSLSNLSTVAATRAEVNLSGRLNHTGFLTIAGKVNPLGKELFLDLKGEARNIDLPAASAYAVRYIGHGIKKGKLSLAADYHIAQRKIEGHNRVALDQLTLGAKVRSPGAADLPVTLAMALLKDRHGIIHFDLPVTGALDDPHFQLWQEIGKGMGNMVVKAATAPFTLIGRAFGGGDQLSHVTFPAGLAILDDAARVKLQSLARALGERRELSLEIQGGHDPRLDPEGLRRYRLERKLKARKRTELVERGAAVGRLEDLRLEAKERTRLLAEVYRAETFAKPRNILGLPRNLPPEEMERLILASTVIDDRQLRALAQRRSMVVKEALARLAPADAGRLFLLNPQTGGARVDFTLKAE